MEDESLVEAFVSITNAEIDAAKHYLEACNYELDRAVGFYMDTSNSHTTPPPAPSNVEPHPLGDDFQNGSGDEGDDDDGAPRGDGVMEDNFSNEGFYTPEDASPSPPATDVPPSLLEPHEGGNVDRDLLRDLPEGFGQSELHEAHMIESVLMNMPFRGNLEAMMPFVERQAPAPLSAEAHEARALRVQQDLEFEESQRRDREKQEAALEQEQRLREAAAIEVQKKQEEAACLTKLLEVKAASLPEEPSESDGDSVLVVIKLPNGSRFCRRFRKTGPVSALFDFIDVETNKNTLLQDQGNSSGGGGMQGNSEGWWKVGGYNLVRQFPRRVVTEDKEMTLEEAGLTDKQETLFVDMKQ